MSKIFTLHVPITKIDEEQRMVYGIATTESIDSQNDIVDYEASKKAFPQWLGNIREMHQPIAIGKNMSIEFDDDDKTVTIGAKISESTDGENAWIKVKEGVLQGFSIGGAVNKVKKDVAKNKDGEDITVTRIVDYDLAEVSLVDNPANPDAMLIMVKSVDGGLQRVEVEEQKSHAHSAAWWMNAFTPPIEKAQALYDNSMKKKLEKAGVAVIDSDPRDANGNTVAEVTTQVPAVKGGTKVLKPVYQKDGKTTTIKAKKGADMKKGLYDAAMLLDLACDLNWYIQGEQYEGEDTSDLEGALATIKTAIIDELTEPTEELTVAVEMAQNAITLKKGKAMSGKKVEKSTSVAGGEERDENANVVTSAEDNTEEQTTTAAEDTSTASTDATDDDSADDADEGEKVEVKTGTKPADSEESDDAEGEESDEEEADEDTDKSVTVGDLRKFTDGLITKLDKSNKAELKKVLGELADKVDESITQLTGRIKTLEDQPGAIKAKASYAVIEKGGESDSDEAELQDLLKRQAELLKNPHEGTPQERMELAMKLRKFQAAGAKLEISK